MSIFARLINPQITITSIEIRLSRIFYTVIVPKKSNIKYIFHDERRNIGIPLELELESDEIRVESKLGLLGKIVYNIAPYEKRLLAILNSHYGQYSSGRSYRKTIRTIKEIRLFLETLKLNNYNVDAVFKEFERLINLPIPRQFSLIVKNTPDEKRKFSRYLFIGIISFLLFITLLSMISSTPLTEFFLILSPLIFLFTVSYIYWLIGNKKH